MKKTAGVFGIGIALLILVVSYFGLGEVASAIETGDMRLIAAAAAVQIIIMLLYAARFKILASKYKRIAFRDAAYITIIGHLMDMLTPIEKIGGQPVMIYLTKKKIGGAKSSAIVMADTILDVLSMVAVVIVVLAVLHSAIPYQLLVPLALFAVIALLFTLGFLKLFLSENILGKIISWLVKKIKWLRNKHAAFKVRVFEKSFRRIIKDRKILSAGTGISFLIKLLEMARIWIVFLALGTVLPPEAVIIAWSFMLLLLFIPWLPGSMGLYEFGASSAFILLGFSTTQSAAGVILDRFISFWLVLAFSLAIVWISKSRMKNLMKIARAK